KKCVAVGGDLSTTLPILRFFFSSRRRHTSFSRDWSSDVCSSDLRPEQALLVPGAYTSFGGIVEVVGVSPGVIDVTPHPATVVAVPVEQAPPVVRWNLLVFLREVPGVGGGPVIRPPLVERAAFGVSERDVRRRVVQ